MFVTPWACPCCSRNPGIARREAVAIAQIDRVDARPGPRERAERAAVHGDEAREARIRLVVAAEVDRQRAVGPAARTLPAAARRQPHLAHGQRERRERVGPRAVARGDVGGAAVRPVELRQVVVASAR